MDQCSVRSTVSHRQPPSLLYLHLLFSLFNLIHLAFLPPSQRLDVLSSIYSMSPPEDGAWDGVGGATEALACVSMPDGLTLQLPVARDQTAAELLSAACKVSSVVSWEQTKSLFSLKVKIRKTKFFLQSSIH